MIYTCALWSVTTTLASTILDVPDWTLAVALGALWLVQTEDENGGVRASGVTLACGSGFTFFAQ
mgnify:CR=1 FL=1